jgi:hypothetical protein
VDADLVATLKLLTDADRLRLLGRIAAAPATPRELAEALDLPLAAVVRQAGLLRRAGLVRAAGDADSRLELAIDRLQQIGRALDDLERRSPAPTYAVGPDGQALPPEDAKVLRSYLDAGRLTTIPASQRKRMVILRWLRDEVFTEGRDYPEKEVNQRIALVHPDVASLRRYMVDAGLVTREAGIYRRSPASADTDDSAPP